MSRATVWIAGVTLAVAGSAAAGADEDLAVVKKAVASAQVKAPSAEAPPAESPPAAGPAPRKGGKPEPQWLRVRIFERDAKGEERKRVSVNLPLSLVRAVGDFPIDLCRHHRHWKDEARHEERRCELKLADVLAALEAGQELVEIDGDEAAVKVWVE